MISPLIGYLLIGLILKTNIVYVSKIFTIIAMVVVLFIARQFLFTSNFTLDFPLAVYFATKVSNASTCEANINCNLRLLIRWYCFHQFWLYVTWFLWITPVVSFLLSFTFISTSLILCYNFYKSWKNDPGYIITTREEKLVVWILY